MIPSERGSLDRTTDVTAEAGPHSEGSLGGNSGPATPGARYRPLRFYAKGGLGEVHVAHDEECNREVALKTIQAEQATNDASRERFEREVEITAGLQHPGIVPVYGRALGADGRPQYAMRLISGETLAEAVLRFHAADGPKRDPVERELALRQLLASFYLVCNVVAYAHSRGIIHRDLKPQNIMLGKYGETLVVDWGLARAFTRSDAERVTGEDSLVPSGESAAGLTLAGQVLGTPAYMSPEQAADHLVSLGPASDIYSLGATLYFLLTGQPPLVEGDRDRLLAKVQAGDVPRARQIKRGTPHGLEAICSKAMALRPGDRYASALELANDIARWLADEPVTAWREPWKERIPRLVRKHAHFYAGAVSCLFLVFPLYSAISIYYNHQDLEEKKRQSDAIIAKTNSEIAINWARVEQLQKEAPLHAKALDEQMKALTAGAKQELAKVRLTAIGQAYFLESLKLKRPPKDLEELKKSLGNEDSLVSPRNGVPYGIAWGLPGQPPPALLAWEQTADATGGRWIILRGLGVQGQASYVDERVFGLLAPPPPPPPKLIIDGKEIPPIQFSPPK